MKNLFCKATSIILLSAIAVISFAGCGKEESSSSSEITESTVSETNANDTLKIETDIAALHSYDDENGNAFAGAWRIDSGVGEDLNSFMYLFDGDGKADLIIDNVGYCGEYALTSSSFVCQLMVGINGTYTYKIGDNQIILTNIETSEQTTLVKIDDFNMLPNPIENPIIDEELLGAWKSEDGEFYYFDKQGIMYHNQFGTIYNYGTYSAKDGVLNSTYKMYDDVDEDSEYSIEGDTLKIGEYEYTKISASLLE
jgi:hypothetical protein